MTKGYQPDPKLGPLSDPSDLLTCRIEDDVLKDIVYKLNHQGFKVDFNSARILTNEISKILPCTSQSKVADYKVKVYVAHGYYEYSVGNKEEALAHAQQIAQSKVYRRATDAGDVEFHTPNKVKVSGAGLDLQHRDTFVRN